MNTAETIEGLNRAAAIWGEWILASSWQIALLVGLVALAAFASRRLSARFRYFLWMLVLVKALTPPTLGAPWSIGNISFGDLWKARRVALSEAIQAASPMPAVQADPIIAHSVSLDLSEPVSIPGRISTAPVQTTIVKQTIEQLESAPALPAIKRPQLTIPTLLLLVWISGIIFFAFFIAIRYRRLTRALASAAEIDEGPLRVMMERLAMQLGRSDPPTLLLSDAVASPFLFGLFRPRIVLPASLPEVISPAQLEDVLLHELTHWRRRDLASAWLQVAVQVLFWFHPLVWLAGAQLRHERECACDEEALASGCSIPRRYGESLLGVLLAARGRSAVMMGFLGIFERNTRLQRRVEEIMNNETKPRRLGAWAWPALILFAALCLPMAAQTEKNAAASEDVGYSPLHLAAKGGHGDMATLLIDRGAEVNARGADGRTPLHLAAAGGHRQLAETLIDRGADVNAMDNAGITPLALAAEGGHGELAQLLLDRGAEVNVVRSFGDQSQTDRLRDEHTANADSPEALTHAQEELMKLQLVQLALEKALQEANEQQTNGSSTVPSAENRVQLERLKAVQNELELRTREVAELRNALQKDRRVSADENLIGPWIRNPSTGHEYAMTVPLLWETARREAQRIGSDLVAIESKEENDWLVETFRNAPQLQDARYNDPESGWVQIGLIDIGNNGDWTWLNSYKPQFENWANGEPNNPGMENLGEMCLVGEKQGEWNNKVDHFAIPALLERETSTSSPRRDWGPEQATGAPDTMRAGDITTAWASLKPDNGEEWLELDFVPRLATMVRIHETFNPGAVTGISLKDEQGRIINEMGVEDTIKEAPEFLEIPLTHDMDGDGDADFVTDRTIKTILITIDSNKVAGWNEIDAVELVGPDGRGWAIAARASSTFAETRGPEKVTVAVSADQPEEIRQNRNWGPEQATGAPDTMQAGDIVTAWASRTPDGSEEWLELDFEPIAATKVRIRETFNPGAVTAIELKDEKGATLNTIPVEDAVKEAPAFLEVSFPMPERPVTTVRITLDSKKISGWNEIDAVELVGSNGRGWALEARASSTFAEPITPATAHTEAVDPIVGRWSGKVGNEVLVATFNDDGSWSGSEEDSSNTENGRWSHANGKYTLSTKNETIPYDFRIDNNRLVVASETEPEYGVLTREEVSTHRAGFPDETAATDPIIGRWLGVGKDNEIAEMSFKSDGTWSGMNSENEACAGVWNSDEGFYSLRTGGSRLPWTLSIEKDRLVVTSANSNDERFELARDVPVDPHTKPASTSISATDESQVTPSVDPIIGRWWGGTHRNDGVFIFNEDNTWTLTDSGNPAGRGTWSRNGETYDISSEDKPSWLSAHISGKKIVMESSTSEERHEFTRDETGPPHVVSTSPSIGATDVDPSLSEISVTFDRDMDVEGFSWTGGGPDFPSAPEGASVQWRGRRTCVFRVKLEAARYYRVGINSTDYQNFRGVDGTPALHLALYFTTVGASDELKAKALKPEVILMEPADGAVNVDPEIVNELRVTFNMPMSEGFSWCGGGENYPQVTDVHGPKWSEDKKTCILPVALKPDWKYEMSLNAPSFANFQSAAGVPLEPVPYSFKTSGAQSAELNP